MAGRRLSDEHMRVLAVKPGPISKGPRPIL